MAQHTHRYCPLHPSERLVLRTVRSGELAGKQFFGYPRWYEEDRTRKCYYIEDAAQPAVLTDPAQAGHQRLPGF